MTLSTVALGKKVQNQVTTTASQQTQWTPICTDATVTDNTGSAIVLPSAITRKSQLLGNMSFVGTLVQLCLRYVTGQSVSTNPVIQVIGFDTNLVPQRLFDANGNQLLTLTVATSTDMQDAAGYSYTDAVTIDANGSTNIMAAIETALVGGGTTAAAGVGGVGSAIMARVL